MFLNPGHDEIDYFLLLSGSKLTVFGNFIPFIQASSAAAGGGVHRPEYGMPVCRGLFTVI